MKLCQLHLTWSGTPPSHAGQDRPITSPSQTPLLSLPAAGGRLWGFLTPGFANFSFKYQREIPSSFCSSSTPLFIEANSRFLSRGTVLCCPWAGAVPVVQQRRKGVICYCRPERERFCSFFCWKGCFSSLRDCHLLSLLAFLTDLHWAVQGWSAGKVQMQLTDAIA